MRSLSTLIIRTDSKEFSFLKEFVDLKKIFDYTTIVIGILALFAIIAIYDYLIFKLGYPAYTYFDGSFSFIVVCTSPGMFYCLKKLKLSILDFSWRRVW